MRTIIIMFVLLATATVQAQLVAHDAFDYTPVSIEPTVWQVSQAGQTGVEFNSLKVSVTTGALRMDDVHIGKTFADVISNLNTSIPKSLR